MNELLASVVSQSMGGEQFLSRIIADVIDNPDGYEIFTHDELLRFAKNLIDAHRVYGDALFESTDE